MMMNIDCRGDCYTKLRISGRNWLRLEIADGKFKFLPKDNRRLIYASAKAAGKSWSLFYSLQIVSRGWQLRVPHTTRGHWWSAAQLLALWHTGRAFCSFGSSFGVKVNSAIFLKRHGAHSDRDQYRNLELMSTWFAVCTLRTPFCPSLILSSNSPWKWF